jgi:mutual gliding-motility protein MglA
MVLINYSQQTVTLKIVYWGPSKSGKTANLKYICENVSPSLRSELTVLEGEVNQTVLFDYMSINAGSIKGFKTTLNLFGAAADPQNSVFNDIVMQDADGIIFVADTQKERMFENLKSLEELENLIAGQNKKIPVIIQYNKRDLENALSLDEMEKLLNKRNYPAFEASVSKGTGIFACLKSISNLILTDLQ